MFILLKKFFSESISLVDYITSFYLSNIIIITFMQILFFYFIYNFCKLFIIKLKETNKNNFIKNNTNLIKNVLLTYHQEQIFFIKKLFDNQTIQQLFFENIFNNEDKIIFDKNNKNSDKKIEEANNKRNNINNTNNKNKNVMYPSLPDSEEEI